MRSDHSTRRKADTRARKRRFRLPALAALLLLHGCGRHEEAAAPAEEPADPALKMPEKIPGMPEQSAESATEVMVKGGYDRRALGTYFHDPKLPGGTIVGTCRFVEGAAVPAFGDEQAVDPASGPDAIPDPRPGEVAYYKNIEIKKPQLVLKSGRKGAFSYQPYHAMLILKDVRTGRRPPLSRPVMSIRNGQLMVGDESNSGCQNLQFAPQHERAQFTTWDSYPSRFALTHRDGGKVLYEEEVSYVQSKEKQAFNAEKNAGTAVMSYAPTFISSPALRERGIFALTDKRHPWIRGYLAVVDNPYVDVARLDYKRRCIIQMDGVPPGRHTVEVFHPFFKPARASFEVEVSADKSTEITVEFLPPGA